MSISRRELLAGLAGMAACGGPGEPLTVGILHSLTGVMAGSEPPVALATLAAIHLLNRNQGGVGGRRLKALVADGASSPEQFAAQAESLLDQGCAALFGCWTSQSRKALLPVLQKKNGLLVYPVQYEGVEDAPQVFYTGATPNQQLVPAVLWCGVERKARRFAMVGSDYVFPRVANEVMRDTIEAMGGTVVLESYLPLSNSTPLIQSLCERLREAKPDVILNTLNGSANNDFFACLGNLEQSGTPVISFSITEVEASQMVSQGTSLTGHLLAWDYFHPQQPGTEAKRFLDAIQDCMDAPIPEWAPVTSVVRSLFPSGILTNSPMVAAWVGVHLWAQAVEEASGGVREALKNQAFVGPAGLVTVDPNNQHTYKTLVLGELLENGRCRTIWRSPRPIPPVSFPAFRDPASWLRLAQNPQ